MTIVNREEQLTKDTTKTTGSSTSDTAIEELKLKAVTAVEATIDVAKATLTAAGYLGVEALVTKEAIAERLKARASAWGHNYSAPVALATQERSSTASFLSAVAQLVEINLSCSMMDTIDSAIEAVEEKRTANTKEDIADATRDS